MQRDLRRQRGSKAYRALQYRALPMLEILEPRCLMSGTVGNEVGFGVEGGDGSAVVVTAGAATSIRIDRGYAIEGRGIMGQPVVGSDGSVWAAARDGDVAENTSVIVRVDTSGVVTDYTVKGFVTQLIAGRDGAVHFTTGTTIGRIGADHQITISRIAKEWGPDPAPSGSLVSRIALGSDGSIWFTTFGTFVPELGHLKADGSFEIHTFSSEEGGTGLIVAGADGSVWMTAREYIRRSDGEREVSYYLIHHLADGTSTRVDLPRGCSTQNLLYDKTGGGVWVVGYPLSWEDARIRILKVGEDHVVREVREMGMHSLSAGVFLKDGDLYSPYEGYGSTRGHEDTDYLGFLVIRAGGDLEFLTMAAGSVVPIYAGIGEDGEMWYSGRAGELVHFDVTDGVATGVDVVGVPVDEHFVSSEVGVTQPTEPPQVVPVVPPSVPVVEPSVPETPPLSPVDISGPVDGPGFVIDPVISDPPISLPIFMPGLGPWITIDPIYIYPRVVVPVGNDLVVGQTDGTKAGISFVVKASVGLFGDVSGSDASDFLSTSFLVKSGGEGSSAFGISIGLDEDEKKKPGDEGYLVEGAG